jgi:acylphosphatase
MKAAPEDCAMKPCRLLTWGFVAAVLAASGAVANREARAMAEDTPARDKPIARLVRYSGHVQGVGFRATTATMARDHPVTGYVKNLPDGRVEVYVEGTPQAVKTFLDAVRAFWKRNIDREQIEEQTPNGKYKRFEIAR